MYTREPLEYSTLKPVIGDETLFVHYNKHYLGYLEKLNNILEKNNYNYQYTKTQLVNKMELFPIDDRGDILYNLGGTLNHELYFKILGGNGIPSGKILEKINRDFGSYDNFIEEIKEKAKKLVGSGYVFVVLNSAKQLQVIATPNQETPYSYGFLPIMAIDLWEHAYYLDYLNNRSTYVDKILTIINYDQVNEVYEKEIKS